MALKKKYGHRFGWLAIAEAVRELSTDQPRKGVVSDAKQSEHIFRLQQGSSFSKITVAYSDNLLRTLQEGTYFGYPVAIHDRGYLATFAANDDYSSPERRPH